MKQKAIVVECQHEGGAYTDNCYRCAPWWIYYPICPIHKKKLSDKGFCRACKKFYDISEVK